MWDWNLIYLSFSSLKLSDVCTLMVLQIICHDSLILAFSMNVSVMNLSHFHFIFNQRQPQRKDLLRKANSKGSNMLFTDSTYRHVRLLGNNSQWFMQFILCVITVLAYSSKKLRGRHGHLHNFIGPECLLLFFKSTQPTDDTSKIPVATE